MKIQKVLFEVEFEDNTDIWVKFRVSVYMFPPEAVMQRCYKKVFYGYTSKLKEKTHVEMWFNKVS